MAFQQTNIHSGNRILVKFDGVTVGLIQSLRLSDDYGPEPASGIGDIHAQEYVPSMARHSINVSNMVMKSKSLRSQGLAPENGDAMLLGVVFDIIVQDKDTGKNLRKYRNCSYASGSVDVSKHAITISDGMFNALDVQGDGL